MDDYYRSKISMSMVLIFIVFSVFWISNVKAGQNDYQSYPELGLTTSFSMPQPSIGYWYNRVGFRFSGMYFKKDYHEFHFNIGYDLKSSEKVQHSINLLTSKVAGNDQVVDYNYWATGLAYSLNYRGFFLEIGLAHPWKDEIGNVANDAVVPCGYWGYVYRFRSK